MTSALWTRVKAVTAEENEADECFTVSVAEATDGSGRWLVIQCSLNEPDEQDAAVGLDSYCVMGDNGCVYYGGITSVTLSDAELELRFTDELAAELNEPAGHLTLTIDTPADQRAAISAGLYRTLTYGNTKERPDPLSLEEA